MSGLSARRRYPVAGGGCPAVKTSVWNHVLWAWGNEAKDTSAMTWWLLYLARGVSDGRNNSGCLHASERSRVQSSVHGQGIQGPTAGLSCCAWSLQRKEIGFLHEMSFSPIPSWHFFLNLTGADWYSLWLSSTQHHTTEEKRHCCCDYVRKLSNFSLYRSQGGKSVTTHPENHLSKPCSSAHVCGVSLPECSK